MNPTAPTTDGRAVLAGKLGGEGSPASRCANRTPGAVCAGAIGAKDRSPAASCLAHTPISGVCSENIPGAVGTATGGGDREELSKPRAICLRAIVPNLSPLQHCARLTPVSLTRGHHRGPSGKWPKWNQGSGLGLRNSGRCSSPEQPGNAYGEPQPMLPEVAQRAYRSGDKGRFYGRN
jgi:hypothetical protein